MLIQSIFQNISYIVLYLLIARFLHSIWRFVYEYFLANAIGLTPHVNSYGEWAVVTGATDGIGKEYAKQLAKKGLNIVIVGRSQEKLDNTEAEIKDYVTVRKCKVKQIKADFSQVDGLYESIKKQLVGLNIAMLVNNVGVAFNYPEFLMSIENGENFCTDMINVNSLSAVRMTQIVMDDMLKRGKGIIVNISSIAGQIYIPLMSVYSASKMSVWD